MTKRWCLIGLLLASLGGFGSGCSEACEVLCSSNGRYISSCLEYWGSVWPDFGFDGLNERDANTPYPGGPVEEYEEQCNERYRNAMRFGGPENIRTVKIGCRDALTRLSESSGCTDYEPYDFELDPEVGGDNGAAPRPTGSESE